MRRRILEYRKSVDRILQEKEKDVNWNEILTEHLQQISFFQHERLVHLIVTMTVALLTILSLGIGLMTCMNYCFILTLMFTILLIPYILHYYILENEVQKMYKQYDEILRLKKNF